MDVHAYTLEADDTFTVFEFLSEGRNGVIPKSIQLQPIGIPNVFNLAFGDKNVRTGTLDDLSVSDNGDTETILATVANAVSIFLERNPEAVVYATGSTPARTRLYRIGISKYFEQVAVGFELYGQIGEHFYAFERGKGYTAFLIRRKRT